MYWGKWGGITFYVLAPVLLFLSVYTGNPVRFGRGGVFFPISLDCAAYTMMCAKFILATRISVIEWGDLDRLIRFYGIAAGLVILLAAHKLFMNGSVICFLHLGDLSFPFFFLDFSLWFF